ncbi:MAG: TrbG/VirB9 family P-type conjugative transfer protein [Vicinamibacterales bacterium]
MSRMFLAACTTCCLVWAGGADAQVTREVSYTAQSVVRLNAKLRFTTMIILPEEERILDFVCGDKEFWVVSGAQNLAYVKPAKARAVTNLNLVTAAGHVYSFLLTEGTADADLKVYVVPEGFAASTGASLQKFYTASDVDALRAAADAAREDARAVREEAHATRDAAAKAADERVRQFKASFPMRLDFPYRVKLREPPFFVTAIYTDGTFTYIKSDATELPVLYELRDGAPNLVNFQVDQGVYVVPKVLESGYLSVGKRTLAFQRVGR